MGITVADVHAIANQIAANGKQPTLAAVRTALGGGSFTTISEAMKEWKAAQQKATLIREAAPAVVIERMGEIATEVWSVALEQANLRLARERDALELVRAEMEQEQKEAAELNDQLTAELESARTQLEQQAQCIKSTEQLAAQLAVAQEAAHTARAVLVETQKRADGLMALLEQERAATKAAQVRAEEAIAEAAKLSGKLEALQPVAKENAKMTKRKGKALSDNV